jgi:glycosyltransferase involved in cell wall biosynthesis
MSKLTVAIIAYYRDFLAECIKSVLSQTYRDFKVIVYDDCSPEDLKSIVDSFDDPRMSYVRNEANLGSYGNVNNALDRCGTEYIAVFHGDDVMLPKMLETEVAILDGDPGIDIVASSVIHKKGSMTRPKGGAGKLYRKNELVAYHCASGYAAAIVPASEMYRMKKLNDLGLRYRVEKGVTADTYFWLESNALGVVYYLLDYPVTEYRLHHRSISNNTPAEVFYRAHKAVCDFIDGLGYDTAKNRLSAMKQVIGRAARELNYSDDLEYIFETRRMMERDGWAIDDAAFAETVFLAYAILGNAFRIHPFLDILKRNKKLKGAKITPPLSYKIATFCRYFFYRRFFY